jgi:hypothetical protein
MTKAQKTERDEAIVKLREWIKPGTAVYTVLDHVSRSGMQRQIRVLVPYTREDGTIDFLHPNYSVSIALGWPQATRNGRRQDGIKVNGCGMDMGFHLVYSLSRVLWPDGYECTGKGCHSNDHSNGDRNYTPHHHNDGGYALAHRWL